MCVPSGKGRSLYLLFPLGTRFSPAFHFKPTKLGHTSFIISNSRLHTPPWCGIMISSCPYKGKAYRFPAWVGGEEKVAIAAFGIASEQKPRKLNSEDATKKHCLRAVSPPSVYLQGSHPRRLLRCIEGGAILFPPPPRCLSPRKQGAVSSHATRVRILAMRWRDKRCRKRWPKSIRRWNVRQQVGLNCIHGVTLPRS